MNSIFNLSEIIEKNHKKFQEDPNHYNKKDILNYFLKHNLRYYGNYEQGTQKWLVKRQKTIGGSEFAFITGDHASRRHTKNGLIDFVKSKIFSSNITGVALFWGNLFEDAICNFIENKYKTKIIVPGSIKGIHRTSYSPDGIAVIKFDENHNLIPSDSDKYDIEKICLFEFKCPYSRCPEGKVPKYYKPQILSGLDNLFITDLVVFAEGIFRICNTFQIDNDNYYNFYFHGKSKYRTHKNSKPITCGIIGVYENINNDFRNNYFDENNFQSDDEDIDDFDDIDDFENFNIYSEYVKPIYDLLSDDIIDFGDELNFYLLYRYQQYQKVNFYYNFESPYKDIKTVDDIANFTDHFQNKFKDKRIIGIIPWKLYRIDIFNIWKSKLTNNYISPHKDKINSVMNIVDELLEYEVDERYEYIREVVNNNIPEFIK